MNPTLAPIFDSPHHELLDRLARKHAESMARRRHQDHAGFDRRYTEIRRVLELGAAEIAAESWRWQVDRSEDELWAEAVRCWNHSRGHWRIANQTHTFIGAAMAKSDRGVWYFCVIAAD